MDGGSSAAFFVAGGLGFSGGLVQDATNHGLFAALLSTGGLAAGSVITPLCLPWLPWRAFSAKGAAALLGLILWAAARL